MRVHHTSFVARYLPKSFETNDCASKSICIHVFNMFKYTFIHLYTHICIHTYTARVIFRATPKSVGTNKCTNIFIHVYVYEYTLIRICIHS